MGTSVIVKFWVFVAYLRKTKNQFSEAVFNSEKRNFPFFDFLLKISYFLQNDGNLNLVTLPRECTESEKIPNWQKWTQIHTNDHRIWYWTILAIRGQVSFRLLHRLPYIPHKTLAPPPPPPIGYSLNVFIKFIYESIMINFRVNERCLVSKIEIILSNGRFCPSIYSLWYR